MRQGSQRLAWLLGGTAGAAGAFGIVLSCLPDLEGVPIPTSDASAVCGDGIIDVDAGEQCDPGVIDGSVPGCSRDCKLECDAAAVTLSTYLDPSSNHCYFLLSAEAGPYEAGNACAPHGAHVITLGGFPELTSVFQGLHPDPGARANEFWLGAVRDPADAGEGGVYSAVVDEPGFTSDGGVCSGCYVKGGSVYSKHPKANAGCVTWSPTKFAATDCSLNFQTLCEREPPGSRKYFCNGNGRECFGVPYNVHNNNGTTYLWAPEATSAAAAVNLCASVAGGTGSLVIFENNEQREQVFYELMHLPRLTPDAGPPTDFWIGLTHKLVTLPGGGTRLEWTWDNGKIGLDLPIGWGDREPMTAQSGVRAYASQSSTSYDLPGTTYDTQLVHAHDPPSDGGTEVHAVLCQIQQ